MIRMTEQPKAQPIMEVVNQGVGYLRPRIEAFINGLKSGTMYVSMTANEGRLQHIKTGQVELHDPPGEKGSGDDLNRVVEELRTKMQVKLMAQLCCGFCGAITFDLTFERGMCKLIEPRDDQVHRFLSTR